MERTAQELFIETIRAYNDSASPMHRFAFNKKEREMFAKMMDKYAEQKWKQACKMQIMECSDKVFDLLNTDGDAEAWHEKVKKTKAVEYDNEPEWC